MLVHRSRKRQRTDITDSLLTHSPWGPIYHVVFCSPIWPSISPLWAAEAWYGTFGTSVLPCRPLLTPFYLVWSRLISFDPMWFRLSRLTRLTRLTHLTPFDPVWLNLTLFDPPLSVWPCLRPYVTVHYRLVLLETVLTVMLPFDIWLTSNHINNPVWQLCFAHFPLLAPLTSFNPVWLNLTPYDPVDTIFPCLTLFDPVRPC
jgi:hypothetical protein